jgi:hypothetical protein
VLSIGLGHSGAELVARCREHSIVTLAMVTTVEDARAGAQGALVIDNPLLAALSGVEPLPPYLIAGTAIRRASQYGLVIGGDDRVVSTSRRSPGSFACRMSQTIRLSTSA